MSIALVDCNSFYCSCEQAFRPDLQGRPVIVLSNNNGCTVARTLEAKSLGISMGVPYFKLKPIVKKHNVAVFSSNYSLYSDMSKRMMGLLKDFTPDIEVYSIDQAFLSFHDMKKLNLTVYAQTIKQNIYQMLGLPVSIGIGKTKVLAKLANHIAKQQQFNGIFEFKDEAHTNKALLHINVENIWGLGRKSTTKLRSHSINTALDLKMACPKFIRKILHLPGEQILSELNGESCFNLDLNRIDKKQILSSRSFGRLIRDFESLRQATSFHTSRVAEKLRQQNSITAQVGVFVQTNRNSPQYFNSKAIKLSVGTDSTQALIKHAVQLLRMIYKPSFSYKKMGVYVGEIAEKQQLQLNLFDSVNFHQEDNLMQSIDKINTLYGQDTISYASGGFKKKMGFAPSIPLQILHN